MAATVLDSGTVGTSVAFPDRHTNLGPFKASNGSLWVFLQYTADTKSVMPVSTSSPGSGWSNGTAKIMASSGAYEAQACYQVGDVIHVAVARSTGIVGYNYFDMSTGAWGLATSETAASAAAQTPTAGSTFVDLVVRSNGEVVFVFNAGQTAMSSTFNMVRYRRRTGTNTYQTAVNVDNGGSVDWTGGVAALGASDRVHFALQGGGEVYQRTLSAANALQTFPSGTTTSAGVVPLNKGIAYLDSGTTRVRVPFIIAGSPGFAVFAFDSADAPTVTNLSTTTGHVGEAINSQYPIALAVNSTDVHYLYRRSTDDDLYLATSAAGAVFGASTLEHTGTVDHITANVYDRSGTKLAIVLDDGGTLKYAEITLTAAVTTSFPFQTETPYRILSRR